MEIQYMENARIFHLRAGEMSYAFGVDALGRLVHLYWGEALRHASSLEALVPVAKLACELPGVDANNACDFEVPTREPFDYGEPILWPRFASGERGLRLIYRTHRIERGHLTVVLADEYAHMEVEAHYKMWRDLPLLSRWLVIRNTGAEPVEMQAVKSAAWHLCAGHDYRLTHLSGNWGCEYTKNQLMLTQSRVVLQNSRLTCAAAQQVPFFAIDRNGEATETMGKVFFGVFHWSGDFEITVEQQFGKRVSVTGGIGTFDSNYAIQPGESFETPAFTGGYSTRGFERMSEILYDWQLDALMPRGCSSDKAHAVRPVIYNSWYPFEFNVSEENCMALIDRCAEIGVEMFVIDDGWMPGRVDASAGLGDWIADPKRFPHGLEFISDACHRKNLQFGLWVEPEMVNPDSDLYRAHPDWVIRIDGRPMTLQRNQLVLNLARDDVRDWIIDWLDDLIETCRLDYLKWDMNRYVSENGWPEAPAADKQSLSIRYTRNLLAIWRHLNERHPDVLFENCASGGGRADFGMVPYADRINRSDNADPVDVMVLHEGFSMLFPPKTAGGAGNIAPDVHHIHGRATPLPFRIHLGMTGSMSIGINLLTVSEEVLEALKEAISEFKQLRPDLQDAYVYRIASARRHPYALFQYTRRDRKFFALFAFVHGMRCWDLPLPRFEMRGLIPDALYENEQGVRMTGEALMKIGIALSLKGDFDSVLQVWRAV